MSSIVLATHALETYESSMIPIRSIVLPVND
jgi:hypothetical protein